MTLRVCLRIRFPFVVTCCRLEVSALAGIHVIIRIVVLDLLCRLDEFAGIGSKVGVGEVRNRAWLADPMESGSTVLIPCCLHQFVQPHSLVVLSIFMMGHWTGRERWI